MKKRMWAIFGCLALLSAGIARAQDEDMRKHLVHDLGGPFIVYRVTVQEELKLSDDQKQKLQEKLPDYIQDNIKLYKKLQKLPLLEREQEMQSVRQPVGKKLWAFLKETLKPDQVKRLMQLELQHEGPGGVGREDVRKALNITQEQLQQFESVLKDLPMKIEAAIKEGQANADPYGIKKKVTTLRAEYETKIESLLTETQKKQWQEMLGKPFDTLRD